MWSEYHFRINNIASFTNILNKIISFPNFFISSLHTFNNISMISIESPSHNRQVREIFLSHSEDMYRFDFSFFFNVRY